MVLLDIVKQDLSLKNGYTPIYIKDLNLEWHALILNLEEELLARVDWCSTAGRSRLVLLVALVADDVGVLHAKQVLCAHDRDVELAHWSRDIAVAMVPLGIFQLFLGFSKSMIGFDDLPLEFSFFIRQLLEGLIVLGGELANVNVSISVSVQVVEELVDDLGAMVIIDTVLGEELVHLVFVDLSIAVQVQASEFLLNTPGLFTFASCERLGNSTSR